MAYPQIEVVVAGTRGFALALLAPTEERVGVRPRVATDPAHALVYCRGPSHIVVVEFLGEDSLSAIKDLVLEGEGLRIVAAVPRAHAAADGPLRALGVEPVRWDGRPEGIVGAVERQVASVSAAPPARPAAAVRPAPAPARAAVPAPRAAPPKPAPAPAGGAPARPAPAAGKPSAAKPALTPTKPLGAVAPKPSAAGAPALTPARAVPAVAKPAAPRPALTPTRPSPAVAPPSPPKPAPSPEEALEAAFAEAPAPAPAPARAGPPSGLFDDLHDQGDHDFDVDVDDSGPRLAAPSESDGAPWPTAVPGAIEAADALGRGLLGDVAPVGTPLAVVGDVLASLSELERAVFAGEPQPIDTEPVRRAAVMRVRVAAALATAPAPGGAVDPGAVSAFLADIDALLSDVNALAAGAPPDVQASLETMRNALVKEAIDFSEAVQHAAPAEALAPAAPAAPRARATQTRVVSVATQAEAEIAQAEHGRRRRVMLAFAAVAAATFAFHGYNTFVKRRPAVEPPALSGIPANADVAVPDRPGMPATVHSRDGAALAPADVARLKESEALKGNVVKEVGPGVVVVIPGAPPAAPPPRAGGK